jgi:hypothetical protein
LLSYKIDSPLALTAIQFQNDLADIFEEAQKVKRTKLEKDKEINRIIDLIENKLNVVMDIYEIDDEFNPPNRCDIILSYGSDYTDINCIPSAIDIVRSHGFTIPDPKSFDKNVSITIVW